MDGAEQARRWQNSKEKQHAAQLCYDHQLYGESVTRSYYACYQAMWAAVGDPPRGLWRHGGLINEFCRGRWATPVLLPTALAGMRKRLETCIVCVLSSIMTQNQYPRRKRNLAWK